MRFSDFKPKLQALEIFNLQDINLIDPNFRLPTLYEWEDKGLVKKIRNKWYTFADYKPQDYGYYLIANRIYSPSYVSLESALYHYGVIPEAVQQLTSVSTLKTQSFETGLGRFSYKSVKEELFFGYEVLDHGRIGVKIAGLEKALLDTLYLDTQLRSTFDFAGKRYHQQILNQRLDLDVLHKYLAIFNNQNLELRAKALLDYVEL